MRDAGWMQMPMFAPPITWQAPNLATLPSWADAKRVAVDVECRDDDLYTLGPGVRRGGYMVGISFAIEDGPAHYLPFAHEGGGNLDKEAVIAYVRDQARAFRGTIIGANLPYDLDYLWDSGIEFTGAVRHADVQIAEPLLDELQLEYNLDAILKRRGLAGKDEAELEAQARAWGVHPKRELWRLHAGAVGRYAIGDVAQLPTLLRRQEKEIDEQELARPWDTECKVLLALTRMTRLGFRVDVRKLEQIGEMARKVIADELAKIHHLTGVRVGSPMNANHLEPAFRSQGIYLSRTASGQPSVTKQVLIDHKGNAVVDAVTRARDYHKLLTTYVAGIYKHMVGDRLHPSFKQMRTADEDEENEDGGARWGRMASKHPNAQAQPTRHPEYGVLWRTIFIPEVGDQWVKIDYSQQEPRTTVHYAELCGLAGAHEFGDRYRNDPTTDSHSMFAEISGLPRKQAKQVFLGLCYGMGGGKLAVQLGLPTEIRRNKHGVEYVGAGPEAQAVLDQFDRRVPFVRALSRLCMQKVERVGYIVLIDGRRCRFPRDGQGNYDWVYKALNRLIQGSAAVQTKYALIALDAERLDPRLTVHDEFNFSMSDLGRARRAREVMADALPLRVPARPDVDVGPNYGELTELAA